MKVVEVSDKLILFNLHNAGLKASDVAKSNAVVNKAFGDAVINTGVEEGAKDPNSCFDNKDHLYEVGIVCDLSKLKGIKGKDFVYSEDPAIPKTQADLYQSVYGTVADNKTILDVVNEEAYNIFMRYMTKFVGSDNCKQIKDNISKSFYKTKDKIEIEKFAFKDEHFNKLSDQQKKKIKDKNENTIGFLLYKIAYTVGMKKSI